MDLMNMHSNKVCKEMAESIASLPIDRADVQRAEEFFDFSKDMDLSILEDVGHYDFENVKGTACSNMMYNLVREDEKEYSDRYVLFLDALGGNTIVRCLEAYGFERIYMHKSATMQTKAEKWDCLNWEICLKSCRRCSGQKIIHTAMTIPK